MFRNKEKKRCQIFNWFFCREEKRRRKNRKKKNENLSTLLNFSTQMKRCGLWPEFYFIFFIIFFNSILFIDIGCFSILFCLFIFCLKRISFCRPSSCANKELYELKRQRKMFSNWIFFFFLEFYGSLKCIYGKTLFCLLLLKC